MSSKSFTGLLAAIVFCFFATAQLRADDESNQATSTRNHASLLHELRDIVIEKIELHNATPKEALRLLAEESIKADPEHRGISFVAHFDPDDSSYRITLSLQNVSVKEALKHMFPYSVGDTVVNVEIEHGCGIDSRTFTFQNGFTLLGPIPPGGARGQSYDLKNALGAKGVLFAPGTSAVYFPEKCQLIVVNSSEEINKIDEILNP